jgi:hypothetical protein
MQFSQKSELKPAFLLPKSAILAIIFSQNQEAMASFQLSEKNHCRNCFLLKKIFNYALYSHITCVIEKTFILVEFYVNNTNSKEVLSPFSSFTKGKRPKVPLCALF